MDLVYSTINIYNNLKLKYKEYLKPEIISIIMIQSKDAVWLETIEMEMVKGGLERQTTVSDHANIGKKVVLLV